MKTIRPWLSVFFVLCILTACQAPKEHGPPDAAAGAATRNNCCSLLHQLLEEQKDVSLLSLIKREQTDLKSLMKRIAETSGAGSKLLEALARQDPSIDLQDIQLPAGEAAVRAAIAATKKKQLLSQKGEEFELTLLLAQTEALTYASHLAKVAAEKEPQLEHARVLAGISDDMQNLYQEAFVMILSKMQSPPARL